MPDFPVTFRDLLHAVSLRHGTDGFTSPPKEGVLRIFSASVGFEPANLGTKGQHAISRPLKPLSPVCLHFAVLSKQSHLICLSVAVFTHLRIPLSRTLTRRGQDNRSVATHCVLDDRDLNPDGPSKPDLLPTQPPVRWVPALFPVVWH